MSNFNNYYEEETHSEQEYQNVADEEIKLTRRDFDDLRCWQLAREFRKEISIVLKTFPSEEKYRLTDQLIRAIRSIADNIAEGHGRFFFKDNVRFCLMARGSLGETKNHLITALDERFIDKDVYNRLIELKDELSKILNGYIRYLNEKANSQNSNQSGKK